MGISVTRGSDLALPAKVGLMSAFLANTTASLTIAILKGLPLGQGSSQTSGPSALDLLRTTLLLFPIIIVSCGSFGFLAGAAGGRWLLFRRPRIHSTKRLLFEAALAGFLLGFRFPWFDALVSSQGFGVGGMGVIQLVLCPVVGLTCALVCALVFRTHFIAGRI
jgi:hypothetical protein